MVKCDKTGVKSREINFLAIDGQTRVGSIRRKLILLLDLVLRFDAFQKRNMSFLDRTESFLSTFGCCCWHSMLIGGRFDLSTKGFRLLRTGVGAKGGFCVAEPKILLRLP